jgi:hypothetical protein
LPKGGADIGKKVSLLIIRKHPQHIVSLYGLHLIVGAGGPKIPLDTRPIFGYFPFIGTHHFFYTNNLPSKFWSIDEKDFPEDAHTIGSKGG